MMLRLDDEQLIEVLKTLTESERRIIELCVQKGLRSEEALEAVRKLKAILKRRARSGRPERGPGGKRRSASTT